MTFILGLKEARGVLEHHLQILPVQPAFLPLQVKNILPVKQNFPGSRVSIWVSIRTKVDFSAAALPHDTQGLSTIDIQSDIIAGRQEPSVRRRKLFDDMLFASNTISDGLNKASSLQFWY